MAASIHPIVVGTAGHIDHGKSSLVRALTGIDPDRLKEEKDRGLTIDLGFASFPLSDGRRVGMVDVPGHERFVRNMVAGSTALDLAVLVVAADDGVMPQTVEHLEILELLAVERGLVALTKIDLVDEETALMAEEEVVELLAGTRLEGARIIRLSSVTGAGLDEFRQHLDELARGVEARSHDGPFRMAVQRVFQLKGIGTVATGIPVSGSIRVGDEVEFLPVGVRSRVRAIQAYGGPVEEAVAGHSTALSVPDAKPAALRRGVIAAEPGIFKRGDAVDIELSMLPTAIAVEHRRPIRFHTGTSELRGQLLVLDGDVIRPGTKTVARVLLDGEVSCAHGDRFLLRLQTPVRTVGGGRVLRIGESPSRYRRRHVAEEARRLLDAGSDPTARVREAVAQAGPAGLSPEALAADLAISATAAEALLSTHEDVHYHEHGNRGFLHEEIERGRASVIDSVGRMLRDKPLAASVSRAALRTSREFPPTLKAAVLEVMQNDGAVVAASDGTILFRDRLKPLSADDQRDLDRLTSLCDARGFKPPTLPELGGELGLAQSRVEGLLARARDETRVSQVGDHYYGASTIERALRAIVRNCDRNADVLAIPELRDELGTSRKYLIPLLEFVDGLGLTQLRGGERRLLRTSELCTRLLAASDRAGDAMAE